MNKEHSRSGRDAHFAAGHAGAIGLLKVSRRIDSPGWLALLAATLVLAGIGWTVSRGTLPRADFTFANETEAESLDPAKATGRPEHRLITALFEGLVTYDARTLEPLPGVAERWDVSPDRREYTFHLRSDARWSDGEPVTAADFQWTFRRLLDPLTAARYAYQLWYVRGAKKYSTAAVEPGDAVEIELASQPAGSLPFARGELLKGRLIGIDQMAEDGDAAGQKTHTTAARVYRVDVGGHERRFCSGDTSGDPAIEGCKLVTLDFAEVGIRALDERTLRLTLEQPTPFFLYLAGFFPLSPVPRHCFERFGDPHWVQPAHIVSNGPYMLQSRRIRDRLRLVKNPYYWNQGQVAIGTIDALSVESAATALNMYLTGSVDWITNVPPIVVADLKARGRTDFLTAPELTVNFYRFNVTVPPLDNVKVRRALSLAIDRQEIVDRVTRAGELPAYSLVPPGIPGYEPVQGARHDVELARQLLAEAGYPDGKGLPRIKILYNQEETHESVALLIQDQWKRQLGVNAVLENLEWGAYLSAVHLMQYQACRSGWVGDYPDPNTFLDMFVTNGANNSTGWSSPRFDELIAKAGAEPDASQRFALLREAEELLLADATVVPLWFRMSRNMVQPQVRGFYPNLLDIHPLQTLSIEADPGHGPPANAPPQTAAGR